MNKGQLRLNSLAYLGLSVLLHVLNQVFSRLHLFSPLQQAILSLLLVGGVIVLGWMALQLFRKGEPTGSNLGCIYLVLLLGNLLLGAVALFFTLVYFFSVI